MRKLLITGGNGQLGSALKVALNNYPQFQAYFTDVEDFDITKSDSVNQFLKENAFDYLINCAAYTAVDKAEEDRELATLINKKGPENLAIACKENNIRFIHISTDYVFDGKSYLPYTENMATNPPSVYGQTKLAGEKAIAKHETPAIIIRTSWLYSEFGSNFLKTMLRLGAERKELNVIFDQIGTPTYAGDLANAILQIIASDKGVNTPEIFHFSNEGVLSWYDFAKGIMEMARLDCKINPIESNQYPLPAPRPHYSVLNKAKIKKWFEIEIPYWKDSLRVCLKQVEETGL